jgi:prevent-host-death family protein
MTTVTVHEAKTHLSRLIAEVLAGGEVVIAPRGKKPAVKIVPFEELKPTKRVLGRLAHLIPPGKDPLEDGFWDPLPDEFLGFPGVFENNVDAEQ